MLGDALRLEYEDDQHIVWLMIASEATETKDPLRLRSGFSPVDVCEALSAAGFIEPRGADWILTTDSRCETMRDVAQQMLEYFDAPGVPRNELLEVQAAVSQYTMVPESGVEIPLMACAWLDVIVRQDLADEARNADAIWNRPQVVIELESICDRRVEQLMQRLAQTLEPKRMAASRRSRDAASSQAKTG